MRERSIWAIVLFYLGLMALAVVSCHYIMEYGKTFNVSLNAADIVQKPDTHFNLILHVLLALSVVMALARVCGLLLSFLHQPPVIGEVIGGILLGPSFLGYVAPEVAQYLIPQNIVPFLGVIAQLGIILYMFLVGLELDLVAIKQI